MRAFDDSDGNHWQAALLEASFGNVIMIFTRIGAEGVLQRPVSAANLGEAEQQLADADEEALRDLLGEATPWP